ncbi:L-ascorbate metabolism protein UlaG (beta-lactamase superfamily) [Kineococcus xinjiangensis]|uniref:L-ascorbate metabolism protein UlaG (Beta-lactamase superfamily) n=1 Tax=Kineococcus xinjiangensis TaxID=512762 RepID=A0A2S6IV01_9ACTN|nr:MBL fold metallo-hydrolase [Kineococcus xinjiangensis]PPK97884.1 L-ascorbate metabolism protein UlaG (beta-lactamase superfamily) [Kineococcus xinjiangensis]
MRITHLGHACLLVETDGARVLIDPGVFSTGFEDLTGLDAVLVTHQHPDHVDAERLAALLERNPRAGVHAELQTAANLSGAGVGAQILRPGQVVELGGTRVEAVGGQHAVIHEDLPGVGNVGLLVRDAAGTTLLHPGDSYGTAPEGVDVLAVPLNAPWAALKETVEFVRAVAPRIAVPVHDGLLQPPGRGIYLQHVRALGGAEVRDLAADGPGEF